MGTEELKGIGRDSSFGDCNKESQWDTWIFLPKSNDVNAPIGIYGANAESVMNSELGNDDNLGIVTIQLFHCETRIPGTGYKNNVVTYAATWKGKEKRPSAIFATAICRDSEGFDVDEEFGFGI